MSQEYLNNKVFENLICTFQKAKRDKIKYRLILDHLDDAKIRIDARKNSSNVKKELARLLRRNQEIYTKVIETHDMSQCQLADAFYTLSENLAKYKKFQYVDIDDQIQEGVLICFEKIDRFDPVKGKAFNYMTTCILNHFRQLYRSARHYNDLKSKYLEFIQQQLYKTLLNGNHQKKKPNSSDRYHLY